MKKQHDVALSFAGEDRQWAEQLAALLQSGGYSAFYDEYELADLWGKDLYKHLSSIYKDQARYCVIFVSNHYAGKLWARHELQSAQARAFEESREYILPVRLDDTEIPGILSTTGYLDLRKMTIEQVYQRLVEKLSAPLSETMPINPSIPAIVESVSSEFVLFRQVDEKQYFIPVQNARWSSTEMVFDLLPESSEATAFLSSLRSRISDQFYQPESFAFAQKENATWVRPKSVTQTTSGSRTVWNVVLQEESKDTSYNLMNDMSFNNISAEQIAGMRARRILLDERKAQTRAGEPVTFANDSMLESAIAGEFMSNKLALKVTQSPIPELYRSFGQTRERFKKFSYLACILYLKLSNTVEDILEFNLELLNPTQLQIRFKGRRNKSYVNLEPSIIEVDGVCSLPSR